MTDPPTPPPPAAPTIRLACGEGQAERNGTLDAPTIHLVSQPSKSSNGENFLLGRSGSLDGMDRPALLVSYVYLGKFQQARARYHFRDWIMDSGAFSVWKSGKTIDLQEYVACCRELLATDPLLKEVIALDVIGDARASLVNARAMKAAGVEAMPVFHIGDDWGILREYCAGWGKVGLSCRFGEPAKDSLRFLDQCFARAWPHRFHSFGWIAEDVMMRYPFHSGDSASWQVGPCAFGNWKSFGKMSVRGSRQNLRAEVLWYLDLERRLRDRWAREMRKLEALPGPTIRLAMPGGGQVSPDGPTDAALRSPSIRLAINGQGQGEVNGALGDPAAPTIRLAYGHSPATQHNLKPPGLPE
jgi:hypothetical protein